MDKFTYSKSSNYSFVPFGSLFEYLFIFWLHRHLPAKQALNSKQSAKGYETIIQEILRRYGQSLTYYSIAWNSKNGNIKKISSICLKTFNCGPFWKSVLTQFEIFILPINALNCTITGPRFWDTRF